MGLESHSRLESRSRGALGDIALEREKVDQYIVFCVQSWEKELSFFSYPVVNTVSKVNLNSFYGLLVCLPFPPSDEPGSLGNFNE